MPKFRVVTPKGASFTVAGGGYGYEKEALDPIGAEIVEAPANEAEFIAAARTADAIYAKGMPITKTVIDALENCKVITLGSVGVDSVDVKAATARGIPVTNVPDTFIEEVADHAMMLLLAGFRRLVEQDRMVREGRWAEGRPALLKIPRLMGQTLGFISFGRVARAVAKRAAPFGLRMMAYDPFMPETLIYDHGVLPATLSEVLSQSDFVSMHAPARPEVHHMLGENAFSPDEEERDLHQHRPRRLPSNEEALIKALQEGWIAHAALDVLEKEPPSHNNPMLRMENVTLTAHVASASARFDEARKRRVGYELSLVLSGHVAGELRQSRRCCKTPRCGAGSRSAWSAARTASGARSLLARPVIAERRVALVELRFHACAVAPERRHVGAACFGRERQRLDFGAGANRGADAHDLHGAMHRALVELLQLDRHLGGAFGEIERALLELGQRKRARRKAPLRRLRARSSRRPSASAPWRGACRPATDDTACRAGSSAAPADIRSGHRRRHRRYRRRWRVRVPPARQ